MFADLHIHMLLSGTDWKAAIAEHQPEPDDILIRNRLSAYKNADISYLRDGGDRFGVCLRARELAPEYGITYRTPAFPIYKKGHYGSFIGRGWSDFAEYRALLAEAKAAGADFIKLMVSGLMDFSVYRRLTEEPWGVTPIISIQVLSNVSPSLMDTRPSPILISSTILWSLLR